MAQDLDAFRRAAAEAAALEVRPGMIIGYGTGRAAFAALEAVARRKLDVRGVPTSERTADLCRRLGLALTTLDESPRLDLVLDGADEVDPDKQVIKGGGGAHVREKLVALAARRRIFIVEETKLVSRLGSTRGIPVALVPFGVQSTIARLATLFPGTTLRDERSDDGDALADVPLAAGADLRRVASELKAMSGVVDHGLFLDLSPEIFAGGPKGVRRL
ncbi:MAG: ribose 5-phosphate isomerase A [Deltaproteobacteria bacterium]|nr:MAG: ribose 5-phosphate isomerase A [Deltaproteobacteria bacterium]TMB35338.1 MAG: ribose 5-phosphate isomerase A [Deltaproteobacteria bacterium]TMB39707.1 MAG: ribose 5-phosphate isomerase A [Deltaproteobacteria bacterium]